ncbi:MAG: hypothetical protein KKD29_02840 [Candidatus Omnitrophica bacterium]|nr:hypothetical protein [Candidatus Omnitrophota bacterium]MBU4487671.1 hypothetical protein [Candidatus Omnitrophota bacterium]MCG2705211.1 hypothetical protein [Candidatus Omnitrophota bacterium]
MTRQKYVFRIIFITWVFMWLLFFVRGIMKVEGRDYKNLFGKTLEEKEAYVTGCEFFDFVNFCKKEILKDSTYSVRANYDQTMDYFRFAYYIYPVKRDLGNPDYIVCYKTKFAKTGYTKVAALAADKYILKRK